MLITITAADAIPGSEPVSYNLSRADCLALCQMLGIAPNPCALDRIAEHRAERLLSAIREQACRESAGEPQTDPDHAPGMGSHSPGL